jgi:opacity protein-like surface antigen
MDGRRCSLLAAAAWALSVVAAVVARPATGQIVVPRPSYERPRFVVGGDIIMAQPRRELAEYISNGWGGALNALIRVEPQGLLHVRFEGGSARYGRDEQEFSFGGRDYTVTTTNNIDWFGLGPQVMAPGGWVRPYASAGFSITRFRTTSVVSRRQFLEDEELGREDNASDFTTGWVFGAGLYVPFGRGSPLSLNLGGRYHFGGEATFVREEDVRNAPLDSSTFPASRSNADFILWQLGLSFALPRTVTGNGL